MLAADWATAITAAVSTVTASFGAGLTAIIPVTFGLAALTMVYHRVKGLIG